MGEVLGSERHHDRPDPERDRSGRSVARLDALGDPADAEQKADCRQHRTDQGQRPADRRRVRHPGLDPTRTPTAEPIRLIRRLVVRAPGIPARSVGRGRGVPGEVLGSNRIEAEVGGQGGRREPGRLDGVEVAVHPCLVPGFPVPAVDLGCARRERAYLRIERRLGPAHRMHEESPGQAEREDRGGTRIGAEHPPNAAHPAHEAGILGSACALASRLRSPRRSRLRRSPPPPPRAGRGPARRRGHTSRTGTGRSPRRSRSRRRSRPRGRRRRRA